MARGEPPGSGPPLRDRPPLPAPYRSPWSGLAEALRAVAADQRLSLQRLWRRNRAAELPLPSFWPQSLAALFWPLLLSAGLALLLVVGGWLLQAAGRSTPPAAGVAADRVDLPAPGARQTPSGLGAESAVGLLLDDGLTTRPGSPGMSGGSSAGDAERVSPRLDGAAPARARSSDADLQAGERPDQSRGMAAAGLPGSPAGSPAGTASALTSELRLDPLLELLAQGEDAGLLLAARPDPAASRLSLSLSQAAAALPQAALLERAQRWQQRAREAGYERLELRDAQGRLRGREALVGSGMILLAPVPGS